MNRFKRFLRQQSGVAMVEFALTFPFFFILIFGGIEITRLLLIQQRLERAGYVIASITGSYPSRISGLPLLGDITETDLTQDVFPQLSRILAPYDDQRRQAIIVTLIHREVKGEKLVYWQKASVEDTLTGCDAAGTCVVSIVNGRAPGAIGPAVRRTPTSFPPEEEALLSSMLPSVQQRSSMLVVEAFYFYQPILTELLQRVGEAGGSGVAGFSFYLEPKIYVKRTYFMPREGSMLHLLPSFTD